MSPALDQPEAGLFEGAVGGGDLGDDVAALAAFIEHALDALYLTRDTTQPLAQIVEHLFG